MPEDKVKTLFEHLQVFRDCERPALQAGVLELSYAGLLDRVNTAAALMRDAGVEPDDRILVIIPNSAEHVIAILAVMAIGAVAVPLDADAGNLRLADVVAQTQPRFCLADSRQPVPHGLATIRLQLDDGAILNSSIEGEAAAAEKTAAAQQQLAFIRFTSGSTGHAKGVVITHQQQLCTAAMLSACFNFDTQHRELLLVSIALSGGWQRVAATLFAGGCVIIDQKPLSVGDLIDMLVDYRATAFFTPPPLVRMLLASSASKVREALENSRSIEIGSAAMTAGELHSFIALCRHTRVYFHYGLTECSRAVILDTSAHPDQLATVGRPAPGVELRIVDQNGLSLPAGEDGHILLRGPQLSAGYWQQPELNRQRFVDGWLASGDYGSVDEAGFLTLRGRHDDQINCGGHCFFPDEVEQSLGIPGGIEHYLVAGVPDPRGVLQQVPWAFVVPVNTNNWSPAGFLALARTRLPAYMVPRKVVVVPRIPMTASGKHDRRETVKLYASGVLDRSV